MKTFSITLILALEFFALHFSLNAAVILYCIILALYILFAAILNKIKTPPDTLSHKLAHLQSDLLFATLIGTSLAMSLIIIYVCSFPEQYM